MLLIVYKKKYKDIIMNDLFIIALSWSTVGYDTVY